MANSPSNFPQLKGLLSYLATVRGGSIEHHGQSSGRLQIKDCRTGHVFEEFEVDGVPLAKLDIKPLDEQSP